jgi:hypothetical protein
MDGKHKHKGAMTTPWRQRRMCVLVSGRSGPAAIRDISARGAFLETNERPPLGSRIELHHPEAGDIQGEVRSIAADGVGISFHCDARSVAFALAAIGAEMSRPPR